MQLMYNTCIMDYETLPHYWVNHLGFQIRKKLEEGFAAKKLDVTAEEWALLLILSNHEKLSPTDLSQLSLRDTTTVSRMLDRLERKALIARRRTHKDRRKVDIEMTPAGRELFPELAEVAQSLIAASLVGVASEHQKLVTGILRKMSANLAEMKGKPDV